MSKTAPGASFEPRQTFDSSDHTPDPSKSLPLPQPRQALLDDIIALYCANPTVERVKRYTPDAVYDDEFGYADNRYKIAGQWFGLPKLFSASENVAHQVIRSDDDVLQWKNEQKWTLRLLKVSTTMKSVITLSLDPETVHSDFIRVKYHKDQASDKDYDHQGLGFNLKQWQADKLVDNINADELKAFEQDKNVVTAPPSKP